MSKQDIDYPFSIRHLTDEEGGGFLIEFPDLPGCMSDGETIAEAVENGRDAVRCWLHAAKESGRIIPKPGIESQSGKWVQRVPKSMHTRLVIKARQEGTSLNTLVTAMIGECLGKRYEVPQNALAFPKASERTKNRVGSIRRRTKKIIMKAGTHARKKSSKKRKSR